MPIILNHDIYVSNFFYQLSTQFVIYLLCFSELEICLTLQCLSLLTHHCWIWESLKCKGGEMLMLSPPRLLCTGVLTNQLLQQLGRVSELQAALTGSFFLNQLLTYFVKFQDNVKCISDQTKSPQAQTFIKFGLIFYIVSAKLTNTKQNNII